MTQYWLKLTLVITLSFVLVLFPLHQAKALEAALYYLKEYVIDLIARLIGRFLLSRMSNSIMTEINAAGTIGDGPLVRDWRGFSQESQYRGEDVFRAMLAKTPVCSYLRDSVDSIFNSKDSLTLGDPGLNRIYAPQPFKSRNACTSSLSSGQVAGFRDDFTDGGWEAWRQLIQPQNNLYGVFGDSVNEFGNQRSFTQANERGEAQAGSGYLSKRNTGESSACKIPGISGRCIIWNNVQSPGDLFSQSSANTILEELDWLTDVDELSEAVVAGISFATSMITSFSGTLDEPDFDIGDDEDRRDAEFGGVREACVEDCVDERTISQCSEIPIDCKSECISFTTNPDTGDSVCREWTTECDDDEFEACQERERTFCADVLCAEENFPQPPEPPGSGSAPPGPPRGRIPFPVIVF